MWEAVLLTVVMTALLPTFSLSCDSYEDEEEWYCGADDLGKFLTESQFSLDCPELKGSINECCKEHDTCYTNQRGRKLCDDIFCNCMMNVTQGSGVCATEDAPMFCQLVQKFGDGPYLRSAPNYTSKTKMPTSPFRRNGSFHRFHKEGRHLETILADRS